MRDIPPGCVSSPLIPLLHSLLFVSHSGGTSARRSRPRGPAALPASDRVGVSSCLTVDLCFFMVTLGSCPWRSFSIANSLAYGIAVDFSLDHRSKMTPSGGERAELGYRLLCCCVPPPVRHSTLRVELVLPLPRHTSQARSSSVQASEQQPNSMKQGSDRLFFQFDILAEPLSR